MSASALEGAPQRLADIASPRASMLPYRSRLSHEPAASVPVLSPGTSSAQIRWTGELLRFL